VCAFSKSERFSFGFLFSSRENSSRHQFGFLFYSICTSTLLLWCVSICAHKACFGFSSPDSCAGPCPIIYFHCHTIRWRRQVACLIFCFIWFFFTYPPRSWFGLPARTNMLRSQQFLLKFSLHRAWPWVQSKFILSQIPLTPALVLTSHSQSSGQAVRLCTPSSLCLVCVLQSVLQGSSGFLRKDLIFVVVWGSQFLQVEAGILLSCRIKKLTVF
jgi:hypothetical protein